MSNLIITTKLNIDVYEQTEFDPRPPETGCHDINLSSNIKISRIVFENDPSNQSLDSIKIDTILECLKYKFKDIIGRKSKEIKSARDYIDFKRDIDRFCGEISTYIYDKRPDGLEMEGFIIREGEK